MTLNVLVAPSGFKESVDVNTVTSAIAEGIRRACPAAGIYYSPMVDGGEGFTKAIIAATQGELRNVEVKGPVGKSVTAYFGILGGVQSKRTAVLEIASACGLSLVPEDQRDPTLTTSFGVGQLILAALDAGAQKILIGCGDSGVNDGGAGMAQALGARLYDDSGNDIGLGGRYLSDIKHIYTDKLDPRLAKVQVDVAVNIHNILLGEKGVARVFGPQKGATPEQVIHMEQGLANYADRISEASGHNVHFAPGSGASGGLGAGFIAFANATLHSRFDIVMKYLAFEDQLKNADLVITAEGALDYQSPFGKVPCEVARRAKAQGIPTIALAGTLGKGVADTLKHGIDAFTSIVKRPCSLQEAFEDGEKLIRRAAEDAIRMVLVGQRIATGKTGIEQVA